MRVAGRLLWVLLAAGLVVIGSPIHAEAHPMPNSLIQLDVRADRIDATLHLPVDDLSLAGPVDLRGPEIDGVPADRVDALRSYVTETLRIETPEGTAWSVAVGEPTLSEAEQTSTGVYRELLLDATLTPPAGGDVRRFVISSAPILDRVVTHTVLVSVHNDWAGGRVSEENNAEQIATITIDRRSMELKPVVIDLNSGSSLTGSLAMVRLGAQHILAGADHMLFLFVLLLPAPLIASAGRWRGPIGTRSAALRIATITAAFTIGHSATLAISAIGRWEPPGAPIEWLIALSILIGAIHALWPLFPGREAMIAGAFGLIHGMAFSFTLAELGLSSSQLVLSLLGFNLGIEIMQIGLVLITLPWLLILARTTWYPAIRIVGAGAAAVAAVGWLLDRLGVPNPVATVADGLASVGWIPIAVLAALALCSRACAPKVTTAAPPQPESSATARIPHPG